MGNEVIIEKAVPAVLKGMNVGQEILDKVPEICKTLAVYGCRNQGAVVEALRITVPHFAEISDTFFSRLNDTLKLGVQVEPQYYGEMGQIAMSDPDLSAKEKMQYVADATMNERKSRTNNLIKIVAVIGILVILLISIIGILLISSRIFHFQEKKDKLGFKKMKTMLKHAKKA